MSTVPKLTVVVLTYNSEHTIKTCLDALVTQKFQEFKVLIVDDDSTDNTLKIVHKYNKLLNINIARNGSNNIARGRNIGLRKSMTGLVAFVDSDDSPTPTWTQVIINTFQTEPTLALISGGLIPIGNSKISKAISVVDDSINRIFGSGILLFKTNNCAINRDIIGNYYFDETFKYAEDLEFASRVQLKHNWQHIRKMKVNFKSRDTLQEYAQQMYRYGMWKLFYEVRSKDYRPIDFIPLLLIFFSFISTLILKQPIILLAIVLFSLMESIFVILYQRPSFIISLLIFPVWLIKNIAWSSGILTGIYVLITNKEFRTVIKEQTSLYEKSINY
jgi:glycosyltransferase involved in cell wall biosynthesis